MTDKVISYEAFLIYKKSKAEKAMKDLESGVFSSAVFVTEDLKKIKEKKE